MVDIPRERLEALGPAEKVVQALTTFVDHAVHNRPGFVVPDGRTTIGFRWEPASWKEVEGQKVVSRLSKVGKKSIATRIGVLQPSGEIREGGRIVGMYRTPGLFPEVVTWMYRQIADVWKLDNDFSAHWASWAFPREHRDLKVILAAFMLCQTRMGDPVRGPDGKVEFVDDDHRAIGEAMLLLRGKNDFNPKLLLRVGDVLNVPGVAAINRELGFGKSARTAFLGRYPKAVQKWLRNREDNPRMLEALVKAGFRTSVMELAARVGYKPETPRFFEILRWKQKQSKDGRRVLNIGIEVKAAESWVGLDERQICGRIIETRPNWKRIAGMLPGSIGVTRAIVAAAVEAGSLSDADMIILTPTLEELGLLTVPEVQARWKAAAEKAENQRAANIATRVKKAETVEALKTVADKATAKVMEEVTRGMRVYVVVDKSGSMQVSLDSAKQYLTKFLGGFPLDRTHVSVFNTTAAEITLKAASATAVEYAFKGHAAGGGTTHSVGVEILVRNHKPTPDEDVIFIFVGDEGEMYNDRIIQVLEHHKIKPVAFGLLKVRGENGSIVRDTARKMGIPCFMIEEGLFNDPYAVTRTLRNLIATTPVGTQPKPVAAVQRTSLVQEILGTPLLVKPIWA